jgi:hypothetical protein
MDGADDPLYDDTNTKDHDKCLGALSSQRIEKLDDNGWMAWKPRIIELLEVWHIFGHATGETKRPSENTPAEFNKWIQNERLAKILIQNNVKNDQMIHFANCDTVSEMWASLK